MKAPFPPGNLPQPACPAPEQQRCCPGAKAGPCQIPACTTGSGSRGIKNREFACSLQWELVQALKLLMMGGSG